MWFTFIISTNDTSDTQCTHAVSDNAVQSVYRVYRKWKVNLIPSSSLTNERDHEETPELTYTSIISTTGLYIHAVQLSHTSVHLTASTGMNDSERQEALLRQRDRATRLSVEIL